MIPKQPRREDKKYLDFIRSKPCLAKSSSCWGEVVPHHTKSRGAWGSDYRTIPVCGFHHGVIEGGGMKQAEDMFRFNHLDEIIKLLSEYLETPKIAGRCAG